MYPACPFIQGYWVCYVCGVCVCVCVLASYPGLQRGGKAWYTLSAHVHNYILRDVNRWAGSNLRRNIRSLCARACSSLVPRPSSRFEGLGTRLELVGRA